jgi:hypothetical protein
MDFLLNSAIISELIRAWRESEPENPQNRHEEGGYVIVTVDALHDVKRWPRGEQSGILPPALDANGRYNGLLVAAAFHTHPNPPVDEDGQEWLQAPSTADRRWHRVHRLPGIVISRDYVYSIDVSGVVSITGLREEVLR